MLTRRTMLTAVAASAVASTGPAPPAHARTHAAYAMRYFKGSPDRTDDSYRFPGECSGL